MECQDNKLANQHGLGVRWHLIQITIIRKADYREIIEKWPNYSKDLGPGGGGNLTCLWYGVVPFLRVPFS